MNSNQSLNRRSGKPIAAGKKAQDAEAKAEAAIESINTATAKMNTQLSSAQQLSTKVSRLESETANQIAGASQHIEDRVTELDKSVVSANKEIAEQQKKLTSTNELVTAMFSKRLTQTFVTTMGNTSTCAVFTMPAAPGGTQKRAIVYMLLQKAPIFQTVQLVFHIYIQPKTSYGVRGNVLTSVWGDPAENLKPVPD
jgi:hypothetical protein